MIQGTLRSGLKTLDQTPYKQKLDADSTISKHHSFLDAPKDIIYDTTMKSIRVVIDTNILYAALYSSSGASHALMIMVRNGFVIPCISVTLVLEYEDVLTRHRNRLHLTQGEIKAFLGFFVQQSERLKIHYLWRPCLKDPNDDMVLEVAVAAGVDFIVTHNTKDFAGSERFGVQSVTPGWFIKNYGGTK